MTQRDLPKVGPATVTPPPVITASVGSWTEGLADFIPADKFAELRELAGWTVEPTMTNPLDILSVNGRQHVLEQLDNNEL
jgi:hypothetical protein